MSTSEHELPPLKEGYEDEFGPIDPEVYQAARKIWPTAVRFGEFALHDRQLGREIFQLRMMDYSFEEIGRILDLNNTAVRTRWYRLMRRLRETLAASDNP